MRRYRTSAGGWQPWRTFWSTANTTVDANGFVREASPIVQLFDTEHLEPVEQVGAIFEKHATGHYSLSGVAPLAQDGWSVEIPRDINGNRQVFVDLAYNGDTEALTLHTSTPVWDGRWRAGATCDIPAGRWIDLRFTPSVSEEPSQTEHAP